MKDIKKWLHKAKGFLRTLLGIDKFKVYKFDDYSTIATVGTIEETIKWYEKKYGEKVDREEIEEVDPDEETMFYVVPFDNQKIVPIREANRGDFILCDCDVYERITLREAYKRDGEKKETYEICQLDW